MSAASTYDDSLWRKSTRSAGNGACIEVAAVPGAIAMRDSKDPAGPVLRFESGAWTDFVGLAKRGALTP